MYFPQDALISAIMAAIKSGRHISIMVGSPLTAPDHEGGYGVPNVGDMNLLIEAMANKNNILEKYRDYVGQYEWAEKYQKGFEFISGWLGQDSANEIIKEAVNRSKNIEKNEWVIPQAASELAALIATKHSSIKSVFTTNFDTLIEEALRLKGFNFIQYTLDRDGEIDSSESNDENAVKIVHLHGTWDKSDTLHTIDQLVSERGNLKTSLKRVLSSHILVVIGYGGWDDIFIEALREIATENSSKFDILWCFYSDDERKIEAETTKLLDSVRPAIQRGRFRKYKGIDIKEIFSLIKENIEKQYSIDANTISSISKPNIERLNSTPKDSFKSKSSKTFLRPYFFEEQPAHFHIRDIEQRKFQISIQNKGVVAISSDWGAGKYGFISSTLKNDSSLNSKTIYRLNLRSIQTKKDFDNAFDSQIGAEITTFLSYTLDKDTCFLFLDNVSFEPESTIIDDMKNFIESTIDFTPALKIIIAGNQSIERLGYPVVELHPLNDADISQYIIYHPSGRAEYTSKQTLPKISALSNGLPAKLDVLLETLRVADIEELIEEYDETLFNVAEGNDYIPKEIIAFLNELSTSENETKKTYFVIMKILAILEKGESYKNIRNYYPEHNLNMTYFSNLLNLGLIKTEVRDVGFGLNDGTKKNVILSLHPLIGSYVRGMIGHEELFKLTKSATDLIFGQEWLSGNLKLNTPFKEFLKDVANLGQGNASIILCSFMRKSFERSLVRESKSIFHISLSYLDYLSDRGRFQDVVNLASELYILTKTNNFDLPYYKIMYYHAKGLRMLGLEDDSISILNKIRGTIKNIDKRYLLLILNELSLAYKTKDDEIKAKECSLEIKKTAKRDSAFYINADSIIIQYLNEPKKIQKLISLEKRARKSGFTLTANNIKFAIAEESESSEYKIKLYDEVIKNEESYYTKIRALIKKYSLISNDGRLKEIKLEERRLLVRAYTYVFNQRIDNFLISCHKVLWDLFMDEKDISSLANLFKCSSLIWRLNGNREVELEFAEKLVALNHDDSDSLMNIMNYAQSRIWALKRTS